MTDMKRDVTDKIIAAALDDLDLDLNPETVSAVLTHLGVRIVFDLSNRGNPYVAIEKADGSGTKAFLPKALIREAI